MAWNFKNTDLTDIAAVAAVHPNPILWWQLVAVDTNDADLQALANEIINEYVTNGDPNLNKLNEILEELRRIADTEAELEVTRIDEDSGGSTVTYQAKGKGFIG